MPPEPRLKFFTDASLGRRIVPTALREAGLEVVAHDDRFPPGTLDESWLTEAGRQDWLILTKDKRIRYRQIERQALERAGVGAFVFTGKDMTGEQSGVRRFAGVSPIGRAVSKGCDFRDTVSEIACAAARTDGVSLRGYPAGSCLVTT